MAEIIINRAETVEMLSGLIDKIMRRYKVTRDEATSLFVEAAFRCIITDDFYKKIDFLLDYAIFPIKSNPNNRIGILNEIKK